MTGPPGESHQPVIRTPIVCSDEILDIVVLCQIPTDPVLSYSTSMYKIARCLDPLLDLSGQDAPGLSRSIPTTFLSPFCNHHLRLGSQVQRTPIHIDITWETETPLHRRSSAPYRRLPARPEKATPAQKPCPWSSIRNRTRNASPLSFLHVSFK